MLALAAESGRSSACRLDQRKSALLYLQGEADDLETLFHRVKLLLVEGVAHYVRP